MTDPLISSSGRIKSALFVDFDNIYIRLSQWDSQLADQFATDPGRWLAWLERRTTLGRLGRGAVERDILVRRCYLNPRVYHPFRPYFIRSAFEVVDCPPLTRQGKTSADIRMVMDILDMLNHTTFFDEFIIFSGDADFTPVLLRLRRHDRQSVVLAIGPASPAYKAACDYLIEQDVFIEKALGAENGEEPDEAEVPVVPVEAVEVEQELAQQPVQEPSPSVADQETLDEVSRLVRRIVRDAPVPVVMARLADRTMTRWPQSVRETQWFGYGRFSDLLANLDLEDLRISDVSPGYVYDPAKHEEPQAGARPRSRADEFGQRHPELAPLAWKIHKLTDTPCLMPEHYAVLLEELADEINSRGYMLTRTSKAVRDRCTAREAPVARAHVNFVLHGIAFTGYRYMRGSETPEKLGEALIENTLNLCQAAQLELTEEETAQVRQWILG